MTNKSLKVFYDGACPLCRREIAFYRKRDGAERVEWRDISRGAAAAPAGVSACEAKRRFHVETAEGEVYSGAAAFLKLWGEFSGFRAVARLLDNALTRPVLEAVYRVFLKFRPLAQKAAARLAGEANA